MLLTEGETPVVTRIASATARLALGAALISVTVLGQVAAHAQASGPSDRRPSPSNGVVDPFTADYITSNVARAQADGAEAVLLTIDTPGGLGSSMDEITQSFLTSTIPVIGYVAPSGARAASAGAFILLSAPVAAMAPGTNVGASTPIGLSGGDISGTLGEKVRNDAAASMRTIAQTYGRNADVAETFVTDAASITADEALAGPRDRPDRADHPGPPRPAGRDERAAGRTGPRSRCTRPGATLAGPADGRVRRLPAHPARPEPRVHLLLARARA